MEKPFKITSFARRREIADIQERAGFESQSDDFITASLIALAHFLEEHHLVRRNLLESGRLVEARYFELWSVDLTEEGLAVVRKGLGNWEKKGCPANDMRPLERAYKMMIKKNSVIKKKN